MSFIMVAFCICGSTYVAMNKKINDNHKAGFFIGLIVLALITLIL